jgi:protein-S-isoprenylcysteine O-methyltransferase Ste14
MGTGQAYGLWPLAVLNTAIFIVFAVSFFHPHTRRDWRAIRAFSAFLVALFTEMYGVPLTVYLLSGRLGSTLPALSHTHAGGHLWNDLIGRRGDPHLSPFHLASYLLIGGGFWLIGAAWRILHEAAAGQRLATTGPYARVRHPQYLGLVAVMVGFLLQWPTIPTLVMFPVLLVVYSRLARAEEREVATAYGPAWSAYAATVPRFIPRRPRPRPRPRTGPPAGRAAVEHSPRSTR